MSAFNQPGLSRSEFRKLLNIRCHNELGVGLLDLPDIICIDDVWWENITLKESAVALGFLTADKFDAIVKPQDMVGPK
jgi:hypothetical protein